ncbi:MAG: hypothetical protein U0234_20030 [Sandaracinus sp.]
MRSLVVVLALALTPACAGPAAPLAPDPSPRCHADDECVLAATCCPDCCACPTVMHRDDAAELVRLCADTRCEAITCGDCPACPAVHPACVSGACVAR